MTTDSTPDFGTVRGVKAAAVALLVLLLAVLWAGLLLHLASQRQLELERAAHDTENLTHVYAEQIRSTLSAVDQTLLLLKHIHELREIQFNPVFALADNVLLKGADLRVRIVGAEGFSIYTTDHHVYAGDRPYFRAQAEQRDRGLFIGAPEFTEPNGEPLIDLSRRLDRPDGSFDGVVVISFNPQTLATPLSISGTGSDIIMGVIGQDHILRVRSERLPAVFGGLGEPLNAPKLFAAMASAPQGVSAGPSVVDGVSRISAWRTLDDYPLFVASSLDIDLVLGAFERHRTQLIAATALISAIFALAGWLLLRALDQRAVLAASVALSRSQLLEAQRLGKIGHFVVDSVRGTATYSDECFPMLGYPPAPEIAAERGLAVIHPDDRERYVAIRDSPRGGELEARAIRADGTVCWTHLRLRPRLDGTGTRIGTFGIVQDITARKLAEAALREKDRQIHAIMDNAPVAIFLKDRDGRYLTVNRQFAESFGIPADALIGRTDAELGPDIDALSRATDAEVLEHGRITRTERPSRAPRPGYEFVEILKFPIFAEDGAIVGLSGFTFNVSERRRIEEQLRQAAKMEAVGRLAGGIAHDFNNMIGAITGFNGFLLEDLAPTTPQRRFAERIAQVCQHARDLVAQVLTFARAGEVDRQAIDLREAVADEAPLIKAALPESTRLTVDVGLMPLTVQINGAQIDQVLLNLCVNASDALGGQPGEVAVRLEPIDAGHPDHAPPADGSDAPGVARASGGQLDRHRRYCAIRVTDTGCGMDQATLDRVFEPFYSTKGPGRGTGLGLAVIHGIVTAYGGAYRVTSRRGSGSAFAIYLPCADAAAPVAAASLLVVDDEIAVTDRLSAGLEQLGYDVTSCNDPAEALRGFEQDPGAWDLLVVDHAMPHMTGTVLIERLKAIRPDCPAILCTTLADRTAVQAVADTCGADVVLSKPLEPLAVAEAARALLGRPAAARRPVVA